MCPDCTITFPWYIWRLPSYEINLEKGLFSPASHQLSTMNGASTCVKTRKFGTACSTRSHNAHDFHYAFTASTTASPTRWIDNHKSMRVAIVSATTNKFLPCQFSSMIIKLKGADKRGFIMKMLVYVCAFILLWLQPSLLRHSSALSKALKVTENVKRWDVTVQSKEANANWPVVCHTLMAIPVNAMPNALSKRPRTLQTRPQMSRWCIGIITAIMTSFLPAFSQKTKNPPLLCCPIPEFFKPFQIQSDRLDSYKLIGS